MADIDDYGMQIEEVVETFHQQEKCVGCDHSRDSWCDKHKRWGYSVAECKIEYIAPQKKEEKKCGRRTPHNAKAVICSDGNRYGSLLIAATAAKVSRPFMKSLIENKFEHKKKTYAWEVK